MKALAHAPADRSPAHDRSAAAPDRRHAGGGAAHATRATAWEGLGNRARVAWFHQQQVQRKARVPGPGDACEHEADRAAEQVVSGSTTTATATSARAGPDRWRADSARGSGDETTPPSTAISASDSRAAGLVQQVGVGRPLDPETRHWMEARFGEPFHGVRIHVGPLASDAADALQAYAFTVGENIVFGEGQYRPETTEGLRLLAHELAHVIQQRNLAGGSLRPDSEGSGANPSLDSASNPSVEVTGRAAPGAVQRQPRLGGVDPATDSLVPAATFTGDLVKVSGLAMAVLPNGAITEKTSEGWDKTRRVFTASFNHVNRSILAKHPGAEANARSLNIAVRLTAVAAFNERSQSVDINTGLQPSKPKPPPTAPPPPQANPPDHDLDDERRNQDEPDRGDSGSSATRAGNRSSKVDQRSQSDPKGALQDAGGLSHEELGSLRPTSRQALLHAAADSPRGSTSADLTRDIIDSTPDRDAGAVADALHANGGRLLNDLRHNLADPAEARALDNAVQDLDSRRLDARTHDKGHDYVDWTPELAKKADEVREAIRKIGRRPIDINENMEGRPDWNGMKGAQEADLQRQLRNLEGDAKRWDKEHAILGVTPDSAAGIAATARAEVDKAMEAVRSAKTVKELFEARKQAKIALWRADQMMSAKNELDRFEASVRSWNVTQSGWAAFASVPSHALGGESFDVPDQLAAEARAGIQRGLARLRDAKTPEEMAAAATELKQTMANVHAGLSHHQDEVYGGAERTIVGIKVVGVTAAAIVAPEYVIPGIIVGAGLGTARQGAQMLDDPKKEFSGMEVFDSAVMGGFLAPFAAHPVGLALMTGYGAGTGVGEISNHQTYTGIFDLTTSLLPVVAKSPRVGAWARPRVAALTLRIGVGAELGMGGRPVLPSFEGRPAIALVVDATGQPVAVGRSSGEPFTFEPSGTTSNPPPPATWETVTPKTTLPPPYQFPVVIQLGPVAAIANPSTTAPDLAGQGFRIELEPRHVERLQSAEDAELWTDLPGRTRTSLGKRYNYIVQNLTREIVAGGRAKEVLHYPEVDAALIERLQPGGGRVVITEGRLKGGKLRFDFAEIDFDRKTVEILDLTPSNKSTHMAKSKAYAAEMRKLLSDFDIKSFEMLYVDEDGNLQWDLEQIEAK